MRSPLLLAIDTSGADAGLVLASEDFVDVALLACRPNGTARTEDLSVEAAALLAARGRAVAELTLVAAVIGPGSYTGLRSGLAFLRGLAFGQGLPAVAVGTLELLAWRAALVGETVVVASPVAPARHAVAIYRRSEDQLEEITVPSLVDDEDAAAFLADTRPGLAALVMPAPLAPRENATQEPPLPVLAIAADAHGLGVRVPAGDAASALAALVLAKASRGQTIAVGEVLPLYVGQSSARPNRHRVVLEDRSE